MAVIECQAGIKWIHVPCKGNGPALTTLLTVFLVYLVYLVF
jgi:hypothetical protein